MNLQIKKIRISPNTLIDDFCALFGVIGCVKLLVPLLMVCDAVHMKEELDSEAAF